jgi:hypothetical protein
MCFTLSRTVTTGRWNWDGDTIVHEPVIRGARRTPNRNRLYDLDIREFLNTKSNEVVARGVGDAIDHLRPREQALVRSHRRGSFDFRVQIMSEYLARHFPMFRVREASISGSFQTKRLPKGEATARTGPSFSRLYCLPLA